MPTGPIAKNSVIADFDWVVATAAAALGLERVTAEDILKTLDQRILPKFKASARRELVANLVLHFQGQPSLEHYVPELRALAAAHGAPLRINQSQRTDRLSKRCELVNAFLNSFGSTVGPARLL